MKHPGSEEVFIDTSAFYAVLDADDEAHAQARAGWRGLIRAGNPEPLRRSVRHARLFLIQRHPNPLDMSNHIGVADVMENG